MYSAKNMGTEGSKIPPPPSVGSRSDAINRRLKKLQQSKTTTDEQDDITNSRKQGSY